VARSAGLRIVTSPLVGKVARSAGLRIVTSPLAGEVGAR
jgi:hypothetical protein